MEEVEVLRFIFLIDLLMQIYGPMTRAHIRDSPYFATYVYVFSGFPYILSDRLIIDIFYFFWTIVAMNWVYYPALIFQ